MTHSEYKAKQRKILAAASKYPVNKDDAAQALDELFLEVVGEDELPVRPYKLVGVPEYQRDELRASIRAIIGGKNA